jgi:hypothetical protein
VFDQGERFGAGRDIVIRSKRRVAVAVAAKVHRRDPEAGMDERWAGMPV